MPKACYYAVKAGRKTGVYLTWQECETQVKNFQGASYKKFINYAEAESFANGLPSTGSTTPVSPATTAVESPSHAQTKKRALSSDAENAEEWDVVFCDGACKGNGQDGSVAGIGVWWGEGDKRNLAERCPGDQTNNRAELIAIARVLETAPMTKIPLLIKTDSQYCVKCFQIWLKGWERNNFKTAQGHPVKNRELIRYIQALIDFRGQYGQRIRLMHVRGHAGIAGNEAADALANCGALFPVEAERDWKSLRMDMLHKIDEISNTDAQRVEMDVANVDPESEPRKLRKVGSAGIRKSTLSSSHVKDTSSPSQSNVTDGSKRNVELTNYPAIVPPIPVKPDDPELELYASCLLNEDEIWMDLED